MVKKRKPRTTGHDLCTGCLAVGCDPFNQGGYAYEKLKKRKELCLCLGCGKEKCKCKSKRR